MSSMIIDYMDYRQLQTPHNDGDDELPSPAPPALSLDTPLFVWTAVDSLSTTSGSFLATSSRLKASSAPPTFKPFAISPMKQGSRYAKLLERSAQSVREQELVDVLRESENRDSRRKQAMIGMQAGVVLAGMYATLVQTQLQTQETRKLCKKGKRKMGDGKAKYFTGDKFYDLAQADAQEKEAEEARKEQRKVQHEAHAVELAVRKKENDTIQGRNEAKKDTFAADLVAWEIEKDEAKVEKQKRQWEKPKWKDYRPKILVARPKKPADNGADEEESQNGSDMDAD